MLRFRKKNIVLWIFMMMALFQPLKAEASEAVICHQHVDGCYKNGPILCTDEVKVTTHAEEFNCATCGRIAAAHVVVETYSCKYQYSERELRRIAYCYTCHSVVQNLEKGGQPQHYRNGPINICGFGTDTVIARVVLDNTNVEWTKETVMLKASVTEVTPELSLAPYSYSFSGGIGNKESCTVSENGMYSVTVTGKNGQTATASIRVSNIDKTVPEIQKFYVDKEYPEYESAMLVVQATDSESGLAQNAYSFDGGLSYSSSNHFKITSNGTYNVYVQDKVGNIATQTLTVNCFETKTEQPSGGVTGNVTGENNTTPSVTPSDKTGITSSVNQKDSHHMVQKDMEKGEKDKIQNGNSLEDDMEKELLKEKLDKSDVKVPLKNIPGMYSSIMKSNAEKNAVPTTLSATTMMNEAAYASNSRMEENIVKNISLNEEKEKADGSFAQVSKVVVGVGVLICIGMVGFLLFFLVKNSRK